MFDETILDRMSFNELSQSLEHILARMDKIKEGLPEDEDDPRLDMLCGVANKIVRRMDSIVREPGSFSPEALAQWEKVMEGYEEHFTKYTDTFLDDDTLVDFNRPETS